jgi:hypothetical protein
MSTELPLTSAQLKERVVHPVEMIQKNMYLQEQRQRLHQIRVTQGWAAAARTSFDQAVLLRTRRLGGLPTSHALFHHYNGDYDDIDVCDVYGLEKNDPNVQPAPRALVEKQFYGEELTLKSIVGGQ